MLSVVDTYGTTRVPTTVLDKFAHVEVTTFDVLRFVVMLRIVSQVARAVGVRCQTHGIVRVSQAQLGQKTREVNGLLGCLTEGMISASQDESATLACFLLPQEMAAKA